MRDSRPQIAILLVAAGLITAVWMLANGAVTRMDRAGRAAATTSTGHIAELIAERFGETARLIDDVQHLGSLLTRAMQEQRDQETAEIKAELDRIAAKPQSMTMLIWGTGASGKVLWSTQPVPAAAMDASGLDYFRAIAGDGQDTFIGHARRGAITGLFGIPFVSAVRDSSGTFHGTVGIGIDAHHLRPLVADLALGPHDRICLLREDGVILANSHDADADDLTVRDDLLQRILPDGVLDEFGIGPVTHDQRFLSVRRVPDAHLLVAVARDAADIFAAADVAKQEVRRWAGLISGLLLMASLILIALVSRARKLRKIEQRNRDIAQSDALLRQIGMQAEDLIAVQDADRRNLYVNPAIERMTGVSLGTFRGREIGSMLPHEDFQRLSKAYEDADRNGGSSRVSYRTSTVDGHLIWLETVITSFMVKASDGGDIKRYLTISRDITGRKQAEDALRDARDHIAALLAHSSGVIFKATFLPDGTRKTVIVSGNTYMGYDTATIETNGFARQRLSAEDFARREEAFVECLTTGLATTEILLIAANGERRWVRETLNRGTTGADGPIVVGFAYDITEEVLAKQRLQQAERLASLGIVATNIAHELNQPLAAMSMAAQNGVEILALPALRTEAAAAKFHRIIEQIDRISQVITHIRLFGGAGSAESHWFSVADAMDGVMLLVEQRLNQAGACVTRNWPADLPRIRAPQVLFEQVLMNLIVNACDAYAETADADARRAIAVRAWQEGASLRIRVADTAGGIAPNVIGRVFDPFFTTKPQGKGTGLGLSISFATITEMGGLINVRNEDGGAAFDIKLPIGAAQSIDGDQPPRDIASDCNTVV